MKIFSIQDLLDSFWCVNAFINNVVVVSRERKEQVNAIGGGG